MTGLEAETGHSLYFTAIPVGLPDEFLAFWATHMGAIAGWWAWTVNTSPRHAIVKG